MCVPSLLCGQWTDLWPFYGLYGKRFSLYIKVRKPYATMPMFADAHISSFNLWLNACPFIYLNPEKKYPLAFGQSPCTGH